MGQDAENAQPNNEQFFVLVPELQNEAPRADAARWNRPGVHLDLEEVESDHDADTEENEDDAYTEEEDPCLCQESDLSPVRESLSQYPMSGRILKNKVSDVPRRVVGLWNWAINPVEEDEEGVTLNECAHCILSGETS